MITDRKMFKVSRFVLLQGINPIALRFLSARIFLSLLISLNRCARLSKRVSNGSMLGKLTSDDFPKTDPVRASINFILTTMMRFLPSYKPILDKPTSTMGPFLQTLAPLLCGSFLSAGTGGLILWCRRLDHIDDPVDHVTLLLRHTFQGQPPQEE